MRIGTGSFILPQGGRNSTPWLTLPSISTPSSSTTPSIGSHLPDEPELAEKDPLQPPIQIHRQTLSKLHPRARGSLRGRRSQFEKRPCPSFGNPNPWGFAPPISLLFSLQRTQSSTPEKIEWAISRLPLILEIRHASWDRASAYRFLRENRIGFCNLDQPQVSYSLEPTKKVTSPPGYLRLHGRNAKDWFREGRGGMPGMIISTTNSSSSRSAKEPN